MTASTNAQPLTHADVFQLASDVATELGEWRVKLTESPGSVLLCGPQDAALEVNTSWRQPGRVTIDGVFPCTDKTIAAAARKTITVLASRGARTIRNEIEQRLFPAYLPELQAVIDHEAAEQQLHGERGELLRQIEVMFSRKPAAQPPYQPGDSESHLRFHLGGHIDRPYAYKRPHIELKVTDRPDAVDLRLSCIPRGAALHLLRVLADYTTMVPLPADCCVHYGPGHDLRYSLPDCPVAEPAAAQPDPAEFGRLYSKYLAETTTLSWPDWLARHSPTANPEPLERLTGRQACAELDLERADTKMATIETGVSRTIRCIGRDMCKAARQARDTGTVTDLLVDGKVVAAIVPVDGDGHPILPGDFADGFGGYTDEQLSAAFDLVKDPAEETSGTRGSLRRNFDLAGHSRI